LACGLLLAFAGVTTAAAAAVGSGSAGEPTTTTATGTTTTSTRADDRAIAYWSRHLVHARAATLRWRAVIRGRPLRKNLSRSLSRHSLARLRQLARRWHRREHWAWWLANHPPELSGWLCIHHYEGSWTDSGAPYWGGLQMDLSFQERYGGWLLRHKGTADHWSPLEQIWAGVRAWRARGFAPWPNTARYCGMLA
jgi:hypothetical protein